MDSEGKQQRLAALRAEVQRLESELAAEGGEGQWPPHSYYTAYHVLAGFVLGMFGAAASLLVNVVGSLLVQQHPLKLIQVYLTVPLGESALHRQDGLTLAVGCCLYLGTGMILGIPFQLVLSRWFAGASFPIRLGVVTVMALGLWLVNYYLLLSWFQPLLFGGRWIVEQIPWWVAALTHLVFGWTMLLVQPLGTYIPYEYRSEAA